MVLLVLLEAYTIVAVLDRSSILKFKQSCADGSQNGPEVEDIWMGYSFVPHLAAGASNRNSTLPEPAIT